MFSSLLHILPEPLLDHSGSGNFLNLPAPGGLRLQRCLWTGPGIAQRPPQRALKDGYINHLHDLAIQKLYQ